MQLSEASWAEISRGTRSVLARSTICTFPVFRAGKANNELLLLGQRTQRPENKTNKQTNKQTKKKG